MKKRRVVITGLGVIAPNGLGKEAFWKALEEGTSEIKNSFGFGGKNSGIVIRKFEG